MRHYPLQDLAPQNTDTQFLGRHCVWKAEPPTAARLTTIQQKHLADALKQAYRSTPAPHPPTPETPLRTKSGNADLVPKRKERLQIKSVLIQF